MARTGAASHLPAAAYLSVEQQEAARIAFYFGAQATLSIVEAAVEKGRNAESVSASLSILREEIDEYMQSGAAS